MQSVICQFANLSVVQPQRNGVCVTTCMFMCIVPLLSRTVASIVIIMMELLQHGTYPFGRLHWSAQPLDKFVKVPIQSYMNRGLTTTFICPLVNVASDSAIPYLNLYITNCNIRHMAISCMHALLASGALMTIFACRFASATQPNRQPSTKQQMYNAVHNGLWHDWAQTSVLSPEEISMSFGPTLAYDAFWKADFQSVQFACKHAERKNQTCNS